MPIMITLTQGVIPQDRQTQAVERITEAFLDVHGLAENRLMRPNVTAHLVILPHHQTFSGGRPTLGAWIETKTPSFALANREMQAAFFGQATEILIELSDGILDRERIWSNGVHTVDGTWNINGIANTNAQLLEAIAAA